MADDLIPRGKDRLHEVSIKLEESHLVYLQTDDSPLKLEQRRKLEGFIKEYLCLVPNENKYMFHETADILHRSAATLQEFSAYRAAPAWSAISLYAANLLAQPWRKEYRILRTYSGYYKHEVQANLIGAELMFEQMGYKHAGREVLILEGPIDPDKVTNVSRDAIVAFVECQILKQIWESVSQRYKVSWLEVLEFREKHAGTPEQAIRALNYRFLEKMHQAQADSYRDFHYPQSTSMDAISSFLPYHITPNNYMAAYPTNHRFIDDTSMMARNHYFHPMDHSLINRYGTCGYLPPSNNYYPTIHSNPYYPAVPSYAARVQSERLIELNRPLPVVDYKPYSKKALPKTLDLHEVDFYKEPPSDMEYYEYSKLDKRLAKSNAATEKNAHETWDFVYKNLDSQGYSKDLGNRQDILHKKEIDTHMSKQKVFRPIESENRHGTSRTEKKRTTRTDIIDNTSLTNGSNVYHETLPLKKKSSSFDLLDTNKYHNNVTENQTCLISKDKKHNSQTLPMPRTHHSSEQLSKIASSVKNLELSNSDKERNKWNCATCTFLNAPEVEICEMCMKSRHKGNEDKPLASGGKECPQCTLVNEKNVSKCDACGTSLKDSPIYTYKHTSSA